LCPTKAGNGCKVVVDGTWFYTSKASLIDMVNGKAKACTFSTIKDDVRAAMPRDVWPLPRRRCSEEGL
jgi:hypothetical protein